MRVITSEIKLARSGNSKTRGCISAAELCAVAVNSSDWHAPVLWKGHYVGVVKDVSFFESSASTSYLCGCIEFFVDHLLAAMINEELYPVISLQPKPDARTLILEKVILTTKEEREFDEQTAINMKALRTLIATPSIRQQKSTTLMGGRPHEH
ncbi:hypothetical protein AO411_2024980 [Salmonella enterica subsp. enterica serovar Sarajane]|nr:hypothetical protein [Salmonella enterica]OIN39423.1 hypothetical protein AO411_2024980 [Salmonella enterica subsp. enterica serovar Sarajane]